MHFNVGRGAPTNGGGLRFLPRQNACEVSEDLAKALGYAAPQRFSINDWVYPADLPALTHIIAALLNGEQTAAVARCLVRDHDDVFQQLGLTLVADADPDCIFAIGVLLAPSDQPDRPDLLKEVVEALPDGFAIFDPEDRLLVCNGAYRAVFDLGEQGSITGLTFEEIARRCFEIGLYDNNGVDPKEYLRTRIASHKAGTGVIILEMPSGRVERIEEVRLPSGHTVGFHADVTALYRESRAARSDARAKSDFLSVMSHEIRTPLVGLIGMLDLLHDARTKKDRERIESVMREAGSRLTSIVNEVLDLSKIESGRMILDHVEFSPAKVLRPIVQRHMVEAERNGVELHFHADKGLAIRVGDSLRLGQIVDNLLSNAVKFTPKGRISLVVSDTPDGVLQIDLSDTGIGMPPEFQSRVMQPFEQADPSVVRKYGGTGLGTAIVGQLTKLFGGQVKFSSSVGVGTRFVVSLPLPIAATKAKVPKPVAVQPLRNDFSDLHALVADDNDINRLVLTSFLSKLNVRFEQAENGREALEAAQSGDFDLILLDISMPEMDGVEVMRRLRDIDRFKETPILAVTANALKHDLDAYRAKGFSDCITKPFSYAELVRLLSTLPLPLGPQAVATVQG